ncbi:hypothetical protein BKA64DRAFT_679808 [Cadophora sp. MPI-SDFR-AT-0126]|nr:hypothetical protein BKA64DRAFT_679808 [Leotiomycetes sp. MPI-SDFR-AT-0126]
MNPRHLSDSTVVGPEPYPFAQPPGKPFAGCAACLLLPKFARLQGGAMKKVIGLITAHGPTPKPQPAKKGPSKVPTAPKAPRSTIAPTADNFTKREPLKDAKTILAHPVSESGTGPRQLEPPVLQAPTTLPAGIQQTKSDPPSAAMSRRDSRTPPPTTSTRSAPRGTDFHPQSVVPAGLSAQLAQIWAQNPFLGKGTVVMQNTVPAVFNKAFVGELFNCFASDTKQAIAAIGEELMCHIHYYVISTGDLFLWTEPHIPGDVGSFNRGHIFITGWVARISSFGMVKPSVHWNAIRTPLAPLQAQPSTIAQPRNTADSLSLLVDYVDNASAVEQKCSVAEKSEFPDPGPPYDLETRKPVWLQVAIKQQQALGAASTRTPIISTKYPSAFEDPEKQWQRYMVAFRTSDVDRLIVEEAVKNEGNLRMIFDKESGQIVSVEELIKRTVYRCSLKEAKSAGTGELGSGDVSFRNGDENKNMKRKLEDGNRDEDGDGKNGRQEKRACL